MEVLDVKNRLRSSFRDPNGFVVYDEPTKSVQRVIFPSYYKQYHHLMGSGLYADLVANKQLISHELLQNCANKMIIAPKPVPFISYPYEWPFHLLKEAALLTLKIAQKALHYGMYLKDATSYNIQIVEGKAIFIDTLSFECYQEGGPWAAYGQFCRHFLAPLLLMAYKDLSLAKTFINFIDGIPLDLASSLLPLRTHFSPFIKMNVHVHAKKLQQFSTQKPTESNQHFSKNKLLNILQYMELFISSLNYTNSNTEWSNYYNTTNYTENAFVEKNELIAAWIDEVNAQIIWDAGGNNGHFSRLIASGKKMIISTDIDAVAVDQNFMINKEKNIQSIIPLVIDLTNPSPAIGFDNEERDSFSTRIIKSQVDCILALALIHHLCLSNNCTFSMILDYFKNLTRFLIIEFIPAEDSWAKELLDRKRQFKHLFDFYNQPAFESACSEYFIILKKRLIPGSLRTVYLLKTKD